MNTDNFQALIDWLHGRHYQLKQDGKRLLLCRQGQTLAVITPPDRYQIKEATMGFTDWVEFNKCVRNIHHYLLAPKKAGHDRLPPLH